MSTDTAGATRRVPFVRLAMEGSDGHAVVTRVAVAGAFAATALAIWGLPAIGLHGPLHPFGIMDFLCGGTRAAHYTVTGQWALAWYYNPLGPLAVVAAGLMAIRTVVGMTTRRWLNVDAAWTRRRLRIAAAMCALTIAILTLRQQLMVEVLI